MTQASSTFAKFSSALRFDPIPQPVVSQAKASLLNILSCAIAGAREPVVQLAQKAMGPYECATTATLIAQIATTDPLSAAFHNCLSSAVLAFDETHARTVLHPVGPVVMASLAFAEERHLNGTELLTALIVGVEAASRASLSISLPPARSKIGWSQSGVCGAIGAAAVARLMGLDATGTADAIALGANTSAGLRAMNGTTGAAIAVANSASNGYRAALMADAGVAGLSSVMEHPYGFVALYAEDGHLPYLTERLGEEYAVMELNFKPHTLAVLWPTHQSKPRVKFV